MCMDKEYEQTVNKLIKEENRRTREKEYGNAAVKVLTTPAKILAAPFKGIRGFFSWLRDTIEYLFMPKKARESLVESAMAEIQTERIKEMKESKKEDIKTTKKKMEIVKDQSLEPTEKVFRLCMLAKTSGKTFEVLTNKGAFRFERCGDNVFVSHALPEYKNKKDQPTYNFQKIGGILFRENSTLIEYEDLYETFQLLASGEEFDTERKSLEQNAIINEIGQVTEKEVTEGENQMQFSDEEQKKMNNAIIAGQTDVIEKMLNEKNKELVENKTQPSVMEQETMFQSTDERVIPDDFFQQDFEQRLAELGQEQKSMDDILYSPTHDSDDFEH